MSVHHFPDPDMPGFSDLRTLDDALNIPVQVLDAYGLEGASLQQLETGSYNIHFRIDHGGETFDLRKSNRPNDPSNLSYEAEVCDFFEQSDFHLTPRIVRSKNGDPNLWIGGVGWTLFRWMGDGPKKGPHGKNAARIDSAAYTLARFHRLAKDFVPNSQRGNWPVFTLPSVDPDKWLERATALADHLGRDGQDFRLMAAANTEDMRSLDVAKLDEYLCHGDYRVRNLQFTNDRVSGVFDLYTSIRSTRLLDLGGAVTRFSSISGDPQADISSGARFLRAYSQELPLTSNEITALATIIKWRLLRDVIVYFDFWWLKVRDAARKLFDGAAESMVEQSL